MNYATFDPASVKATLRMCLKSREKKKGDHKNTNSWLVDWTTDWTEDSIEQTVKRWIMGKCFGTKAQMRFTAEVLEYVKILQRACWGHDGTTSPLPPEFPIHGPIFIPPTVEYMHIRPPFATATPFNKAKLQKNGVASDTMQHLLEPVQVMSPVYYPDLALDHCPVPGCTEKTERRGFAHKGFRTIYGLASNLKVIGLEFSCPKHKSYSTTSPDKFWSFHQPWQLAGVPHFQERSGLTRELFNLIIEMRLLTSAGQLVENLRQLHIQYNRERERAWLSQALRDKAHGKQLKSLEYPTELRHAATSPEEGRSLPINPHPSESTVRAAYEYFIEKQRREESERYTRTLTGLTVGLDATLKIAKKANIYVQNQVKDQKKTSVINFFEGGLLTGVNEDKELVIRELLLGNSPLEMGAPLLEFAERSATLGVDFRNEGEACVDRCCDFRSSVLAPLPRLKVGQDLAHLKNRILETVPKRSSHREKLGKELTAAFISVPGDRAGRPAQYHSSSKQVAHLDKIWEKYEKLPNVWSADSKSTFDIQRRHAAKGCLVRRHADRACNTSVNENWHGRFNSLTRGNASSLPTVEELLTDGSLRFNLNVEIYNLSQPADSPSRRFRSATKGSHHLFLLNDVLRKTEQLTGHEQPSFLDIHPDHHFGLVSRDPQFAGLTLDRYKNLRESLQNGVKNEEQEMEVFVASTLNGEADVEIDLSTISLPPPSPGLGSYTKRSYSAAFEVIDVNDDETQKFEPPTKVQRLDGSSPTAVCSTEEPLSRLSDIKDVTLVESAPTVELQAINADSTLSTPPSLHPPVPRGECFPLTAAKPTPKAVYSIFARNTANTAKVPPSVSVDNKDGSLLDPAYLAGPNLPQSENATASTSSSTQRESRSASTFTQLMGASATKVLAATRINSGTTAYYRFAALRLKYQWSTKMPDRLWTEAAVVYNNSATQIEAHYYNAAHPMPQDTETRSGVTLKKFCVEFEDTVRQWLAAVERGEAISAWKNLQITLVPPERAMYNKATKTGKTAKAKTCRRCGAVKDGKGVGQGHPRDNCADGFPVWERVPYPLGNASLLTRKEGSKRFINADTCISAFRTAADKEKAAHDDQQVLDMKTSNLLLFEQLARSNPDETREAALSRGRDAYNFGEERFKKQL